MTNKRPHYIVFTNYLLFASVTKNYNNYNSMIPTPVNNRKMNRFESKIGLFYKRQFNI